MKIAHHEEFTPEELASYRPIVYENVLESAHALIKATRKLDVEPSTYATRLLADKVLDYRIDESTGTPLFIPQDITEAIHNIWQDDVIKQFLDDHSSAFYLMDSGPYFFTHVLRIGAPDYIPNLDDVLRARAKTTGITETTFSFGLLSIHIFDVGGQRSERIKWINCFESMTSIIFCTALSEYDQVHFLSLLGPVLISLFYYFYTQVLPEEQNQNRMEESLALFESVVNSRWFLRTSIILFLNKIDLFKTKIRRVPLERYVSPSSLLPLSRFFLISFLSGISQSIQAVKM